MFTSEEQESEGATSKVLKAFRDTVPFLGLGIQLAATVIVMFFIGQWLDNEWNTGPWLMILFIFLGVAAGFYQFMKIATRYGLKSDKGKK